MSEKEKRIQGQKVSEKIYKDYYKMKRRQRYLEEDVKVGRIEVDMENEKVTFVPNKEDSLQRLMDLGADYKDELSVEDLVVDKAMLLILQEAMKELDRQEKELIHDLFYQEKTVREVAKKDGVSHVTVMKRRDKILDKLRKFF